MGQRGGRATGRARALVLALVALVLVLASSRAAHADKVDRLIKQLSGNNSYKVRLSAAINLTKIADERAIPAFIGALSDEDKNIRGLSASALGKLVTAATPSSLRKRAEAALTKASKDPTSLVRKQAKTALAAIQNAGQGGSIYIDIGPMASKTKKAKAMKALMRSTAEKTFQKKAQSMVTTWPGGKAPTAKQLRTQGAQGFHVDGTLVKLDSTRQGKNTLVACKVSMLLATFPKKSVFGFLDGGARVQTGSAPRDVELAEDDCVAAVVEDLITKKIIPTIRMRTSSTTATQTTTQTRSPQQRKRRARNRGRSRRP